MKIDKFEGQYRFLSNFWPAKVWFEGIEYPSVEHAYQAAKTFDKEERRPFADPNLKAGEAKRLGRQVTQRSDWHSFKLLVMRYLVARKFEDEDLQKKLSATGESELVEGNMWHDIFWGVCNCSKHQGQGENHLGKILMKIRHTIKQNGG